MIKTVLDPIWHEKPEAVRKALSRLNLTWQHAVALDLDVDVQAAMKARVQLGKQQRIIKHIPSLPYSEAPAFYQMLCNEESNSALALRFLILTVARTSEVWLATHDEVDGDIWMLPEDRQKSGCEHRIPLVTGCYA